MFTNINRKLEPILYEIEFEGRRIAFFHPGVGAPLAAGMLEEVAALGCRKFIVYGVQVFSIKRSQLVLLNAFEEWIKYANPF